jgi:hypothetical protein
MNIHIGFVKFSLVDVLRPAFARRCTAPLGRADKYTLVRAMYASLSIPLQSSALHVTQAYRAV